MYDATKGIINKMRSITLISVVLCYKGREAGETDEGTDEPEITRLQKGKLMEPGKFAFVQKYLEDVQDTRSMTTETSDSGLATHPAASELGTDEISGKYNIYNIHTEMPPVVSLWRTGYVSVRQLYFAIFERRYSIVQVIDSKRQKRLAE